MKHPINNQDIVKSEIRQRWEKLTSHTLPYKEAILNMCDKIYFYDCAIIFFSEKNQITENVYAFLFPRENIIHNM